MSLISYKGISTPQARSLTLRRAVRQLPMGWWLVPGAILGLLIWVGMIWGIVKLIGHLI